MRVVALLDVYNLHLTHLFTNNIAAVVVPRADRTFRFFFPPTYCPLYTLINVLSIGRVYIRIHARALNRVLSFVRPTLVIRAHPLIRSADKFVPELFIAEQLRNADTSFEPLSRNHIIKSATESLVDRSFIGNTRKRPSHYTRSEYSNIKYIYKRDCR